MGVIERVAAFGIREGRDGKDTCHSTRRLLCHFPDVIYGGEAVVELHSLDVDAVVIGKSLPVHHQSQSVYVGNLSSHYQHGLGLLWDEGNLPFLAPCNDERRDVGDVVHDVLYLGVYR